MEKGPLLQLKACSTENVLPQIQLVGKKSGVQPYLRKIASECSLMKGEANVLDGQCCQPGGGT